MQKAGKALALAAFLASCSPSTLGEGSPSVLYSPYHPSYQHPARTTPRPIQGAPSAGEALPDPGPTAEDMTSAVPQIEEIRGHVRRLRDKYDRRAP
jgi:hypothetical protein